MMQAKVSTTQEAAATKEVFHRFRPSMETEEMFQALQGDGLKSNKKPDIADLSEHDRVPPKEVAVYVDVRLEREKDRNLPHRVMLANQVRDTILTELQSTFHGGKKDHLSPDDLVLCVRVLLVSDGSSKGRRWTAAHGVGSAKLTLAYCLQSNVTGKVTAAHQLYATENCAPGASDVCFREYSEAVLRTMARSMADEIKNEVGNEITQWTKPACKGTPEPKVKEVQFFDKHDWGW